MGPQFFGTLKGLSIRVNFSKNVNSACNCKGFKTQNFRGIGQGLDGTGHRGINNSWTCQRWVKRTIYSKNCKFSLHLLFSRHRAETL